MSEAPHGPVGSFPVSKPKLLVVELWGLGDLAIATPFLRAASQKYAVTVLAKPYAKDLQARFWPEVEVVPFNAPWTAFTHKYRLWSWPWRELIRLRRQLSAGHFDFGFSARWDPRDHLLLSLVGAKIRLGFSRMGSEIFLTQSLLRPGFSAHRYDSWRVASQALGVELPPREQLIPPTSGVAKPILVHSGARLPARIWPLESYRNLVRSLREKNYAVQVACDPDQEAWWRLSDETAVVCPHTVNELLSRVDQAAVFVGNCSGPGHLAAISGVPTFTIFGPSLPEWFLPLHPAAEWVEGQPCPYRPCSDYCHFSVPHCLWNLKEETVRSLVLKFVVNHERVIQKAEARTAPQAPKTKTPPPEKLPFPAAPRRVLHVNNSSDIYGASRMLLRYLKTVDRRHFQAVVVLPEEGQLKVLLEMEGAEVVLHPGLSVITRPVFKSWRLVLFLLKYPLSVFFLWRLIRRQRIELVHTNTGVMISPALAAWLARRPHVWHIRDWFQEFQGFWPTFSWYVRTLSRKIVAVSNPVANQFSPPGTAMVIHDGFSLDEFRVPKESLNKEFRSRYGLGEEFVVGCVGRIKQVRKGQEVLVRATAILKKRQIAIKALVVGAPFPGNEEHLTQIQELAGELGVAGDVVFTGELPDARPAYAAMDILALTSAQPEPFGGVVMEAMAMGLPVIATNIGGSLDQVLDGVTGLLVPPADPLALADAIAELKGDPALRQQMGAAGIARIQKHFTLVEMTAKMEELFEEVISRGRG